MDLWKRRRRAMEKLYLGRGFSTAPHKVAFPQAPQYLLTLIIYYKLEMRLRSSSADPLLAMIDLLCLAAAAVELVDKRWVNTELCE